MPIISVDVDVPEAPGHGSWVNVAAVGVPRTIICTPGASAAEVNLEFSGDGVHGQTAIYKIGGTGSNIRLTELSARFVRAVRTLGTGAPPDIEIQGPQLDAVAAQSALVALVADAAAGSATGETPFYKVPADMSCLGGTYTPNAAITGSANNATINVRAYDYTGATRGTIAILTTSVSFAAKASAPLLGGGAVFEGDLLTYQITKNGSGVALPAAVLALTLV
jgi:hypothetical protein